MFLHEIITKIRACDYFFGQDFYETCLWRIAEYVPEWLEINKFGNHENVYIVHILHKIRFNNVLEKLNALLKAKYDQLL